MKALLLPFVAFSISGIASAEVVDGTLFNPSQLEQYASYSGADTGAELFALTDNEGIKDDIFTLLFEEKAGLKDSNSFGIYQAGSTDSTNRLQIFDGSASAYQFATVVWTGFDHACVGTTCLDGIDRRAFGFYLSRGDTTFYSEAALNADYNQMLAFYTGDFENGGFDYILAFEDLLNNKAEGHDGDFNDMIVGVHDIKAVPLPTAAWTFGATLMCFLGLSRRKHQAS